MVVVDGQESFETQHRPRRISTQIFSTSRDLSNSRNSIPSWVRELRGEYCHVPCHHIAFVDLLHRHSVRPHTFRSEPDPGSSTKPFRGPVSLLGSYILRTGPRQVHRFTPEFAKSNYCYHYCYGPTLLSFLYRLFLFPSSFLLTSYCYPLSNHTIISHHRLPSPPPHSNNYLLYL